MKEYQSLETTVELLRKRLDEKAKIEDAKIIERGGTISLHRVLKIVQLRTLVARREYMAIANRSNSFASKPSPKHKRAAQRLNEMIALEHEIEETFLYNGSN